MKSSLRRLSIPLATILLAVPAFPVGGRCAVAPPPAPAAGADRSDTRGRVPPSSTLAIPGPLRPLLRLAAVSRLVTPDEGAAAHLPSSCD